jgi:hypothetical protein
MMTFLAAATDGIRLPPGASISGGGASLFSETLMVFWIGGGIFALMLIWAWFKYGRKRSGKRKRRNRQIISDSPAEVSRSETTDTPRRRNRTLAEAGGLPPPRTHDSSTSTPS